MHRTWEQILLGAGQREIAAVLDTDVSKLHSVYDAYGLSIDLPPSAFPLVNAYPGPNAISPTFEVNFARLEHTAMGKFNLAYMRHTEKWHEQFADLTLKECLKAIKDDPWFQP